MANRDVSGMRLVPGKNCDAIHIGAGLKELRACGYTEGATNMVIEIALARWARGEEAAAERMAIDASIHGIDFTSWRRVLAASMAGAMT